MILSRFRHALSLGGLAIVLAAATFPAASGQLRGAISCPVMPALGAASAVPSGSNPSFWGWAPKPPMGWNSYDTYGDSVTEAETVANAEYMRDHLKSHGWEYVVIDFRWYDSVGTPNDADLKLRAGAKLAADAFGRMVPAENRFPSSVGGKGFKPLADRIHAMGLRFGFHMMRGIPRQAVLAKTPIEGTTFTAEDAGDTSSVCRWCPDMYGVKDNAAGQAWYDAMFRLYASWGLDFIKIDDLSAPYAEAEIGMIRKAIDRSGRKIVLSTSPGPTRTSHAEHVAANANMWRMSGDFWDQWKKLDAQFDLMNSWDGVGGPGHFPDADMIPFGHLSIRSWVNAKERDTRFTHDEERTLMSLWSLGSSPLMLGFNLPNDDAWTDSLLTNDEVIAVDQDALGIAAKRVSQKDGIEVWVKTMQDGSKAIGLFNRGNSEAPATLDWATAGLSGKQTLRDLWLHKAVGAGVETYTATLPAHGSVLLRTGR